MLLCVYIYRFAHLTNIPQVRQVAVQRNARCPAARRWRQRQQRQRCWPLLCAIACAQGGATGHHLSMTLG